MKKANRARNSSKTKARTRKGKRQVNPILDILNTMDDDQVAMLRQMVQGEMGLGFGALDPGDPVDLFAEYLDACAPGHGDEDARNELLADLAFELSDLRVAGNGGDPEAREKIQAIYDLLDNAIERHSLAPTDLMLTGKIFADAGWAVPNSLTQAMAEALQTAPPDTQAVSENDIVASLLEIADQVGQNPFDVHEHVSSLLASLPAEASGMLLHALMAGKNAVINQAVAGFVLHPDAVLAQSAADALAASAQTTPVESSSIERLVRLRPWLPPARQAHLDAAIRAMRLNALPPVKTESPKLIKCYVSVCDGSGTQSLFVTQRTGARYQVASVMIKPAGVADAMVLADLSKSEMDNMVRQMKSSILTAETDVAGIARMLGLAIAGNFASENLPPFKLVEVAESLGLGPVHPDHASPAEIIRELLADVPPEQQDAAAVARAHTGMLDGEFKYQWFDAGEAIEDLLHPVKGFNQRVATLLKDYMPGRRSFWARQCAISALALRGDEKTRHLLWKQLALVGRDIASDLPVDRIPLMQQVAEISVEAFESRL